MYIFTTAAKNIRRYAGRYLLFGALIFAVLAVGTVSLVTQHSLDATLAAQMAKYGGTVTLSGEGAPLFPDDYREIKALDMVETITHSRFSFALYQQDIAIDGKACDTAALAEDRAKQLALSQMGLSFLTDELERTPGLAVIGLDATLDPEINAETMDRYLLEGRLPEADHEAALCRSYLDLLDFADVALGSTLTLTVGGSARDYTVVGFTRSITAEGYSACACPITLTVAAAERFYTEGSLDAAYRAAADRLGIKVETADQIAYTGQVRLKSYTDYDRFVAAVAALGHTAERSYTAAEHFLVGYRDTARMMAFFTVAVIAVSAVVVLVMTALGMHERRYEIGVLLAVGMPKSTIAGQFAAENLIFTLGITVLAYAAGLIFAPLAAAWLTDSVIIARTAAALPVAGTMLALAVGLSLPASLISSLAILRFKPMTILRSRT